MIQNTQERIMKHAGGSVMARARPAASGTPSLNFIDDQHVSRFMGKNSIMQQDNDPQHTAHTTSREQGDKGARGQGGV